MPMAAATWSLPVTPVSLSPGQTPNIVPTVKFVSTILEPSKGSNATLNPPAFKEVRDMSYFLEVVG